MKIKNSDFLLDPRHKSLIAGKSTRLYKTWENDEFSYSNFIGSILMALIAIFLLYAVATYIVMWFNFKLYSKETTAVVTDCTTWKSFSRPRYEYKVDDVFYHGSDSIESYSICEQLQVGTKITIRYLEFDPQQAVYLAIVPNNESLGVIFSLLSAFGIFVYCGKYMRPMIRAAKKFRRLKNSGTLVDGEVYFMFVQYPDPMWRNQKIELLMAMYKFVSPTTGHTISGERKKRRKDITKERLPKQGTSVTILFVDDDCHLLL